MSADKIHYLPGTDCAENNVIEAGRFLEELRNIPFEELEKMNLSALASDKPVPVLECLIDLAVGYFELAKSLAAYQQQREINKLLYGRNGA